MSCYQQEASLQKENPLLPRVIRLENGHHTHLKIGSETVNPSSASPKNGFPRRRNGMSATSISSGPQETSNSDGDVGVLEPSRSAFDKYLVESNPAIQTSRIQSMHPHAAKSPPRVHTPIELSTPIPPPSFIPPPPKPVQLSPKNLALEQPHGSSGMDTPQNEIMVQESWDPPEIHRPLPPGYSSDSRQNEGGPRIDLEWQEIEKLRVNVWSMRSEALRMRGKLRELQFDNSRAEDVLLQRVSKDNLRVTSGKLDFVTDEQIVAKMVTAWRHVRGQYGPLEDDYNQLEDLLSDREFELTRREKELVSRLRSTLDAQNKQPPISSSQQTSASGSPLLAPTTIEIDEVPQDHPKVIDFLSRIGDLDLLQEQLVEIQGERGGLQEERISRQRFGLSLAPEDQLWLDNSQSLLDDLIEKIRLTEEDVAKLRYECLRDGLIDEHDEPTDFQSQERRTFQDEDDINPAEHISEYVKYPILLPKPGSTKALSKGSPTKSDEKPVTLGKRVNEWLLDQLRESPLEVSLLARTFEGRYGRPYESWEVSVLAFWDEDGTANTTGYHIYTSSMTTQVPLASDHSTDSVKSKSKSYGLRSFRFVLSQRFRTSSDRSEETEKAKARGRTLASQGNRAHGKND